jgi:hypothetical protein
MKLFVATPAYGDVMYTPYVRSLLRLQRTLHQRKDSMSHVVVSYAEVSEARNFLLTHWFDKSDASHILFVDADMGFEPELIQRMLARKKPVVGVVYPRRQLDLERVTQGARGGDNAARATARGHDFILRTMKGALPTRDGFLRVAGVGAGILLIERGCIAAMLKKLPAIDDKSAPKNLPLAKDLKRLIRAFDPVTVGGARLSEDFSFCHRWAEECGGEIWANVDTAVAHVGLYRFGARYLDTGAGKQRVQAVVGGKAQGGAGLRIREGEGPKTVRGKLAMPLKRPKPAPKNGGKPVRH